MKKLAFTLLLFVFQFHSQAQQFKFVTYPLPEGFQNSQITTLFQDSQGYVWVGTLSGILRFDGVAYTDMSAAMGLESTSVECITQTNLGQLWVGTQRKGVARFKDGKVNFLTMRDGLASNFVNCIFMDSRNRTWLGTNGGLTLISGGRPTNYTMEDGHLPDNKVNDIVEDAKGTIWIGTENGIASFNGQIFNKEYPSNNRISKVINTLAVDDDNNILAGTFKGIVKVDSSGFKNDSLLRKENIGRVSKIQNDSKGALWIFTYGEGAFKISAGEVKHYRESSGLPSDILFTGNIDHEGNVWFATRSGLTRLSGELFATYTRDAELASDNILSALTDKQGNLWFGTLGRGLVRYQNGTFYNYGITDGLMSNTVWSLTQDELGIIWAGTDQGLARYNPRNNTFSMLSALTGNTVYALAVQNGKLWAGTDRGVHILDGETVKQTISRNEGLRFPNVRVLYSYNDKMWIGTTHGLYMYGSDSITDVSGFYNYVRKTITSIIADHSGNVVAGVYDKGIMVIPQDLKPGSLIRSIEATYSLEDDNVLSLYLDTNQIMWVGSSSAIERINWQVYLDGGKGTIVTYGASDGYLGVECNAISPDMEGNIWFGTVNGIVRLDPAKAGRSYVPPRIQITNVKLFNIPLDSAQAKAHAAAKPNKVRFSHNENFVSFEYMALYFSAPEKLEYQYMLEGQDLVWSQSTKAMQVSYNKLKPGKYIFKVRAAEKNKSWSEAATFEFEIQPHFLQTGIAYAGYAVTGLGLILLFLNIRTRRLRIVHKKLSERVHERTKLLQQKTEELERLSVVAEGTDNAIMMFDSNLNLEWINNGFTLMTGYDKEGIVETFSDSIHDLCFNNEISDLIDEHVAQMKSLIFEGSLLRKNGTPIFTSSTLTPIADKAGNLSSIVIISSDITERKKMEEDIKNSLNEKQKLLREIHHRVKNNLQIIISLLNLQSSYVVDKEAIKALKEGQDRVKTLALIHEKVYQSDELSDIEFASYVKKLIDHLFLSYGVDGNLVKVNISATDAIINIDTAVPCGLIITELVTNSIKYAFQDNHPGELNVIFKPLDEDNYLLSVQDNGKGLPLDFDIYESDSLGMQLLIALVDQIEGKIEVIKESGLFIKIVFPKPQDE